jgi:hypothetical protein
MIAAYIIDRLNAPLWLAILTLFVLLAAAVVYPWVEKTRKRPVMFWGSLIVYGIFATLSVLWLPSKEGSASIILKGNGPFITRAMFAPGQKLYSVEINTAILKSVADRYNLIAIIRIRDNSTDAINDTHIMRSSAFTIDGEIRTIQIDLSDDFIERARSSDKRFGGGDVDFYLGAIPKNIKPEQILTLNDITMLGGRQVDISPQPQLQVSH